MGTKVSTLAEMAGVKCPKESEEKEWSCTLCEHYEKCRGELLKFVLG